MENAKQRRARKVREAEANRIRQATINGYCRMTLVVERDDARESPCVIGKVKPSSRDESQTMDGYGEKAAREWVNANVTDGNTTLTDEYVNMVRRRIVNAGNSETVKRSAVSPKTPDEIAARHGKHKGEIGVNPHCGCTR